MPKFGLFKVGLKDPSNVYEGDSIKMDKEFVQILKHSVTQGFATSEVVAAIRLEKGFDVRKIAD